MLAVIFRAEPDRIDESYHAMAKRMRDLAISDYGCLKFISAMEGNTEIAISYWQSQDDIKVWKENIEHITAQSNGKSRWYKNYTVQVTEVKREYSSA